MHHPDHDHTSQLSASAGSRPSPGSPLLLLLLLCVLTVAAVAFVRTTQAGNEEPATANGKAAADGKAGKAEGSVVDADGKPLENPFPNRFPAPSFDEDTVWLNTSGPITLKDLRGKVVLVDFWTYCCINCMHVLPDLKYLEHKFPDELVVIGCHSAKFDNEKDTEAIREAIVRYEIEHPVINDSEMLVWRKFGARAWPTVVLLDPEGNYCGYVSGEGNRELLENVIERLVAYHSAKGTLDATPFRFDLERQRVEPGPLRYPGKLLADAEGGRVFVSDSNHNRIVVSSLDGTLLDVIGSGRTGAVDGGYAEASFDHPQGMALHGNLLYVADTENHLLRVVDLAAKTVSTLAGTGQQARFRAGGGELRSTALNSPWDLTVVGNRLFIAMAGPHQIWSHELGSETVEVFSGSGREDIINGPHQDAALAQPSGIISDGKFLYVADSEGSAIRKLSVDPAGEVTTIAGTHDLPNGRTLFEFGDRDGVGSEARLQHPLGVALRGETLYVADSYNHKIRAIDLKTRETTTWLGTGSSGDGLEPVQLHEPAGLTIAGDRMLIADTNNHRIVSVDLATGKASAFTIQGLLPPVAGKSTDDAGPASGTVVTLPAQKVAPGRSLRLQVRLQVPETYKINMLAPVVARLKSKADQPLVAVEALGQRHKGTLEGDLATFEIPLIGDSGSAEFQVSVSYGYCREGVGGLCRLHTASWSMPLELAADGAAGVTLTTDVPK